MREAFRAFYNQWFDRVYAYARHRTGSTSAAEEVAADVFKRALESWETLDSEKGEARSWLFSIAFRAVADHFRARARRKWLSLDVLSRVLQAPEPSSADGDAVRSALATLSEKHQDILALRFVAGLTNREIARMTGHTESNVAVILFRSIRRMRRLLSAEASHG